MKLKPGLGAFYSIQPANESSLPGACTF